MRNKTYQFTSNGIASSHPFKIKVNNNFTNIISGTGDTISFKIDADQTSDFFYQCHNHSSMKNNLNLSNKSISETTSDGNYDFYYGDISISVLGNFNSLSIYCFYHGYMGGQNLFYYLNNIVQISGDYVTPSQLDSSLSLYALTSEIGNFNNLETSFNLLYDQVQNLSGSQIATSLIDFSQDILNLDLQINNIKNSINNLDLSYLTDLHFENSFNYLNPLIEDIVNAKAHIQNELNSYDLSNRFINIDSSLSDLKNQLENNVIHIENKNLFEQNIHLLENINNVNIINSNGNKFVFNNLNYYDENIKYGIKQQSYKILNIPYEHPIALLNNDVSNLILYNVIDSNPITIKVRGGNLISPYYELYDSSDNRININNNNNDNLKFMKNRTYHFIADGINSTHPFKIFANNNYTNEITGNSGTIIVKIDSLINSDFFYQCGNHSGMKIDLEILNSTVNSTTSDANYNFYYGDISINVLGDFGNLSVYCFYHGYMGGENLFQYLKNYYTTNNTNIQDLSNLFFNTITPSKNNSNILININASLYCSYAFEERISIELWRDLSMLTQNNNLGSVIATGGLTIPYNLTYLDNPNSNNLTKYYLKYNLENNNSKQEMGIINIQSNSNYGCSNIILREL